MPAIALVAAFGTISAGAALGGVLGGVMLAGGVMSGLGAVTGNKELSKWGAVASLGAGIGSAMGLAASANAGWNSLVGGADSALGVTGNSFLANGGSMSAIGDAIGYKGPAPAAPALGAGDVGKTAGVPGSDSLGYDSMITKPPPGINPTVNPAQGNSVMFGNSPMGGPTPQPGLIDKITGGVKDAWGFVKDKNNAEVVKAGAGLIGGAMTNYEKQRQEEAMVNADNERRARFNRSILEQRRNGY